MSGYASFFLKHQALRLFTFAIWMLFVGLVAASGMALGGFIVEWVRNMDNGSSMYHIGAKWLERALNLVPFGDWLNHRWNASRLHRLTAHFPGLLFGGGGAFLLWMGLSLGAAWQNCLLFRKALVRTGLCFLPLHIFWVFWFMESDPAPSLPHWICILPFGAAVLAAAGAIRRISEQSLPTRAGAGSDPSVFRWSPFLLLMVVTLWRFLEWLETAFLRHHGFHSHAYDLGFMGHVLSRAVTGHGLTSSMLLSGESFLEHHFSPILYLFVPFYFFCPHPEALLFFQTLLVSFATAPLYYFAREWTGSSWTAFALAWAFLLIPGLSLGIYSDYHVISCVPILFFWLAYESVRPGSRRFWAPLVLLLCVQENVFLYTTFLGVILSFHPRCRKNGLRIFIVSISVGLFILLILQPVFSSEAAPNYGMAHRYEDFLPESEPGETGFLELLTALIAQPGKMAEVVFDRERLQTFKTFWQGIWYASLWNPAAWPLLLPLLENTLSSVPHIYTWGSHYAFGPVTLSAAAMVMGFGLLKKWNVSKMRMTPLSFTLLFSAALWSLKHSHLPYSIYLMTIHYSVQQLPPSTAGVLLSEIPPGQSVAAQSNLIPHMTHQRQLHLLPPGRPQIRPSYSPGSEPSFRDFQPDVGWPDYLVFDPETKWEENWYNLWFFGNDKTLREEVLEWIDWLIHEGNYKEIYPREGEPPSDTPIKILKKTDRLE